MTTEQKYDISETIAEMRKRSPDDGDYVQSDVQWKTTNLKLRILNAECEQKLICKKLLETEYRQELIRLERLTKNNDRRPILFNLILYVIVAFYLCFALCVLNGPNPTDVVDLKNASSMKEVFSYFTVLMFLLAGIPTLLLIVLIRAIFSPQEKLQKDIVDSLPASTIAKSIVEK